MNKVRLFFLAYKLRLCLPAYEGAFGSVSMIAVIYAEASLSLATYLGYA
ncbi:MAG: hypothetical protein ACLSH8_06680 [Zhenhengia sp.]